MKHLLVIMGQMSLWINSENGTFIKILNIIIILFLYQIIIIMSNIFYDTIGFAHNHILFLNNSKFFAGVIYTFLTIIGGDWDYF
jgi:hypothetical protein